MLEFVEMPGADRRGAPVKYTDEAQELQDNPMIWAKADFLPKWINTTQIKVGHLRAFTPPGHYEAAVRGGQMFIRYVGEPNAEAE